jgi:hypothetical protein
VFLVSAEVRYVEFRCSEMTPTDVQSLKHENQIFSIWKAIQEKEEKALNSKLSLRAVDEQAVPMWEDRSFFGVFCDAFVENTELEGGQIGPSVTVVGHALNLLLNRERQARESSRLNPEEHKDVSFQGDAPLDLLLSSFDQNHWESLCYIQKVFKTTTELCKEHDFSKGEDALGPFVQTICLKIQNLKLNEVASL